MEDFNFFAVESAKQEKEGLQKALLLAGAASLLVGLIAYPVLNQLQMSSLQKNIQVMAQELEDTDTGLALERVEEKTRIRGELTTLSATLLEMDQLLTEQEVLDDALLKELFALTPARVYLKSMTITPAYTELSAFSESRESIAQWEYQLKQHPLIEEVFIPSIEWKDDYYQFTVRITQEETPDEANP